MNEIQEMNCEEWNRRRQEEWQNRQEELRLQRVEAERQREAEEKKSAALFGKLAAASLAYAVIYTVCLYKNTTGLFVLFWIGATIFYINYVLRMFQTEPKRDSAVYAAVLGLLGVSTVLTGNEWIVWLNYAAIFLLVVALLLHNFCRDADWDLGKYAAEITVALCGAMEFVTKPFTDGAAWRRGRVRKENGKGNYIAAGIGIAVPCVLFLGGLLVSADMVFADMVFGFFGALRLPTRVFGILFMLLFGFFSSYCGVRYVEHHAPQAKMKEHWVGEPVLAVTVTSAIALLYVIFCGVQVSYLFVGGRKLPDGVTYAEYARSGFFQLLFVCLLNLMLVLGIRKYFRESRLLGGILLVISACTFVMTASSAYRMLLYISAYHLTFLRVAVLVALAAIALLMCGVVLAIVKPGFPLLRYGATVVGAVYLIFSFSRVDYLIASYNLAQMERQGSGADWEYVAYLSTDAAPAVEKYCGDYAAEAGQEVPEDWHAALYQVYRGENAPVTEDIGLRNFNLSHYRAHKIME